MKAIASFLVLCSASVAAWAKDTPADTAQIKRGEYLAIAADCAACHTAPGGKPFAGGLPMPIPMLGTIYTSNITPDEKTGIGKWSYEDFERAVRRAWTTRATTCIRPCHIRRTRRSATRTCAISTRTSATAFPPCRTTRRRAPSAGR